MIKNQISRLRSRQEGFSDTIFMAIIGGIIGSLFIVGVFVWMEIDKANIISVQNHKTTYDVGKKDIGHKDEKQVISSTRLEIKAPFSLATIDIYKNIISYNAEAISGDTYDGGGFIDVSEIDKLNEYINQIDFWSFEDKYISDNIIDATYYTVTVASCNNKECGPLDDPVSKSVICYGQCPVEIQTLIDDIKELWGQDILEVGV